MKVGVFLLSFKRPDTTPKVVKAIQNQTVKPHSIYLFNNNPEIQVKYPGVININSEENFRCIIRHAIALTRVDIDYCLFVDDDVVLKPEAIANFLKYSEKYPEAILGYYGRDIIPERYYSLARTNFFTGKEREVDLVLGMVHFCKRVKLTNSFILKKEIPDLPLTEDDIILSLGNKFIDKQKNYVIPYTVKSAPISLGSMHKGLSSRKEHGSLRVDAVKRITEWAAK